MRPHNTLFGERIIKEPRCAGACVPVFWLTLWEQAGPRRNQGWDAGLTPWHTRREASLADSPFAHVDTTWRMGQYSEFWWHCSLILGCQGNHGGVWRDRLERQTAGCRSSAVWESIWRSFCKTKKADTHFGRANEAFDIQPKISVSLLLALLTVGPSGCCRTHHRSICIILYFLMMLNCHKRRISFAVWLLFVGNLHLRGNETLPWWALLSTLRIWEKRFFHWGHNLCDTIIWLAAVEVWTRPGSPECVTVHVKGAQWDKRESSREESVSFESKLFLLDL